MRDFALKTYFVLFLVFLVSCSSDPEGPVSKKFMDDGSYPVKAGSTFVVKVPVNAVSVPFPVSTGNRPLLGLGRIKDVSYRAILIKFDFTSADTILQKNVTSAHLELPVASPDSSKIGFEIYELSADFSEGDTIAAIPDHASAPIPDSIGGTERTLDVATTSFTIDVSMVSDWLNGGGERSFVLFANEPDSSGLIEMNAREMGIDPIVIRVDFDDGTEAVYAVKEDYNIITAEADSLDCIGGVATRTYFTFDISSVNDSAMVHASFLVLNVDGSGGFGATAGDKYALGFDNTFLYYLYAPVSADVNSEGFKEGKGVDRSSFIPNVDNIVRCNLRGYIPDVIRGARKNTGLVFQSDQEATRVQETVFKSAGAEAPYIEIIYSLPGKFGSGE